LVVMALGWNLGPEVEEEERAEPAANRAQEAQDGGFFTHFKQGLSEIKEALRMPEIYLTVLCFLLMAIVDPQYSVYWYYFQMNVVQFSKL